ncbi:MAG: FHA domain-containing protein [Bacteroidota bacterium]
MKIKCINCSTSYEIKDSPNIPTTCEHCNEDLEWQEIKDHEDKTNAEIVNLIWTKQRDSSSFNVEKSSDVLHLIGRLHHGSEVLGNILQNNVPIISKTHCSVEFSENNVYLKDEGSTNGTFLGHEKISCINKLPIKDNQLVWLANELFIVTFEYKKEEEEPQIHIPVKYRCRNTGDMFDSKTERCESCGEYNCLIEV